MWQLLLFILCFTSCVDAEESKVPKVHGFLDVEFKNDYITPRGLLVTNTGFTTQILLELNFDICKAYELSWIAGVWNDLCSEQDNPHVGVWNELDWYTGLQWIYAENWNFKLQFVQFLSPPGNFRPENNLEALFTHRDIFNPYLRFFWAVSGDSTVVVGRKGNTYYVEFGMNPTWNFGQLTISVPSWISIGPESFWNGGKLALKNERSHFGVFSTGLSLKRPVKLLESGSWAFSLGVQYYYLINDNLLQAQKFTLASHLSGKGIATSWCPLQVSVSLIDSKQMAS